MSEPLERALADVNELRQQREAYRRDLKTLDRVKQRLLTLEDKLANAKWEHEVLQQRYERLKVCAILTSHFKCTLNSKFVTER